MIKAIIFDMDGVICDTEFYDFQVQRAFILKHNPDLLEETDLSVMVGQSYERLYQTLKSFIGNKLTLDEIEVDFKKFVKEAYQNVDYLSLFRSEIINILDWAKVKGIKLAVASSSPTVHIMEILETCGIKDSFDIINSGEHFQESKPNPEIYLQTLSDLGVAADEAIAIEDSANGIRAAKNAGIKVVAYRENRLGIDQTEADEIVDDMKAFKQYLLTF